MKANRGIIIHRRARRFAALCGERDAKTAARRGGRGINVRLLREISSPSLPPAWPPPAGMALALMLSLISE